MPKRDETKDKENKFHDHKDTKVGLKYTAKPLIYSIRLKCRIYDMALQNMTSHQVHHMKGGNLTQRN
jgi:hypothetical protein